MYLQMEDYRFYIFNILNREAIVIKLIITDIMETLVNGSRLFPYKSTSIVL